MVTLRSGLQSVAVMMHGAGNVCTVVCTACAAGTRWRLAALAREAFALDSLRCRSRSHGAGNVCAEWHWRSHDALVVVGHVCTACAAGTRWRLAALVREAFALDGAGIVRWH